jgi:hypothetical protein
MHFQVSSAPQIDYAPIAICAWLPQPCCALATDAQQLCHYPWWPDPDHWHTAPRPDLNHRFQATPMDLRLLSYFLCGVLWYDEHQTERTCKRWAKHTGKRRAERTDKQWRELSQVSDDSVTRVGWRWAFLSLVSSSLQTPIWPFRSPNWTDTVGDS